VFHDSQLDQTTNIPLGRTPLGILLADKVELSGDVTVTHVAHEQGMLEVSLVRTASPGDGTLTLYFLENPFVLREWVVTDAQRQQTRVTLFNPQLGGHFDENLFSYVDPKMLQGNPQ
jgi:outer membrane lipoprotein-sorting protein